MEQFLQIGLVGVATSIIVEFLTRKTSGLVSKAIAVAVSLVLGTFYYFAQSASWWQSFLGVLATASTVYALVFNRETKTKKK